MSDSLKALKKRRNHRSIEALAECIGCSTHAVKDWLSEKYAISDLWAQKIEAIPVIESVDVTDEEREAIMDATTVAAMNCGSTAALARKMGVSPQYIGKVKLGRVIPPEARLQEIKDIASLDLRPDKVSYSPEKTYARRWNQTVVGAVNEYAQKHRKQHAEEYKRIARMRNWDICPVGACKKCDMDCTARTNKNQAVQTARAPRETSKLNRRVR